MPHALRQLARLEEQSCLTIIGYDVGPLDGIDGPRTETALQAALKGGPLTDDATRRCWQGIQLARATAIQASNAAPTAPQPAQPALPQAAAVPAAADYGDTSPATGLPRTEYVHGYTRKDGTQVQPYYRSHR
jgi:hypothetical protein